MYKVCVMHISAEKRFASDVGIPSLTVAFSRLAYIFTSFILSHGRQGILGSRSFIYFFTELLEILSNNMHSIASFMNPQDMSEPSCVGLFIQ